VHSRGEAGAAMQSGTEAETWVEDEKTENEEVEEWTKNDLAVVMMIEI